MDKFIAEADKKLNKLNELIKEKPSIDYEGALRVGVDLGTANIVVTVVDDEDNPLLGANYSSKVVRDGLVVDYIQAINVVRQLKDQLESQLGRELITAAAAVPPGTGGRDIDTFKNVVQGAGFEVSNVVDEPSAAATVLGIEDGVVVDIGGGTTGISILEDSEVTYTADEATGGTHLSLVIAGNKKIDFEEAEVMKKDSRNADQIFHLVVPVIDKIAAIINRHIRDYNVEKIYLVGGTSNIKGIETVLEKATGLETIKPSQPLLVTPLGIAMNCQSR